MFHWESEGLNCHRLCTAIVPFWFSTEHPWIVITPFWFSTDDMYSLITPSRYFVLSSFFQVFFIHQKLVLKISKLVWTCKYTCTLHKVISTIKAWEGRVFGTFYNNTINKSIKPPEHNTLLKPKRHSLRCHGFMVHALLLRMHTNVVYFRVMRRLCRREWNWPWNWRCVNLHPWQRTRDHGVWRLTLTAYCDHLDSNIAGCTCSRPAACDAIITNCSSR